MSSNVEKLLKSRLISNDAVTALAAGRVYPVMAPQKGDKPYVIYSRTSTEFITNSTGYAGTGMASLSVVSWGATYESAKALADAVRSALTRWRDQGANPKIDGVSLINESDVVLAPEEGKELPEAYGVAHELDISFEES